MKLPKQIGKLSSEFVTTRNVMKLYFPHEFPAPADDNLQ